MSYAEVTMKSGAVVTFDVTQLAWESDILGTKRSLKWTCPDDPKRRPLHLNLDEVAAVIWVSQ